MTFNRIAFAKGVLRRQVKRTKEHSKVVARCSKVIYPPKKDGSPGKSPRRVYQCPDCRGEFSKKEVELDHIIPVARHRDLDEYVELLFCDADGLTYRCKNCHKIKSKIDNEITRQWKKENPYMSRKITRVIHAGFVDGVWHLLFRNKSEALQYCEDNNLDEDNLDKLDNGLWRLETDLTQRFGETDL